MKTSLQDHHIAPAAVAPEPRLSHLAETLIGSEIVKLAGEIKEKIRQGQRIYNFTVGDFDPQIFPIPKELEFEIIEAYRQHFTNYPLGEGNLDLREAVSAFIKERSHLDYHPGEILIASGGRPLIYSFFRSVADKGDKVIYAVPSWNNNHYVHLVDGEHCVIEAFPEKNFMPTAADIEPHLKGAAVLALCTPQNPTGTTMNKDELAKICDMVLAENESRPRGAKKLYLMYDQMYSLLCYGDIEHADPVKLRPAMKEYTVYIDAISKCFAATGVRVGWSFGPAAVIHKMKAILSHLGAWAPMAEQKATAKFLPNTKAIDAYLKDFKSELEFRLREIHAGFQALKKQGFDVDSITPQAGIYLTIQLNLAGKTTVQGKKLDKQSDVTAYILDDAGLAVVPFYAFGASRNSNWYRLSVGTCVKEEIPEMLDKLKQSLQKLS